MKAFPGAQYAPPRLCAQSARTPYRYFAPRYLARARTRDPRRALWLQDGSPFPYPLDRRRGSLAVYLHEGRGVAPRALSPLGWCYLLGWGWERREHCTPHPAYGREPETAVGRLPGTWGRL